MASDLSYMEGTGFASGSLSRELYLFWQVRGPKIAAWSRIEYFMFLILQQCFPWVVKVLSYVKCPGPLFPVGDYSYFIRIIVMGIACLPGWDC